MNPVGSVEPKLLSILAVDAAVNIFRQLLWAEASAIGLGPSLISVPGAINSADGGVDAEVNAVIPVEHGLFVSGMVRYQIKTGSFSAGNKSELNALLFNKEGCDFHARVRSCFEKGGTFVAVLFGAEAVDRIEDQTEESCREAISKREPRFRDCRIRILRQNQIAGLLNRHLSLSLQAQMRNFPGMRVHSDWRVLPFRRHAARVEAGQRDWTAAVGRVSGEDDSFASLLRVGRISTSSPEKTMLMYGNILGSDGFD